MRKNFISVIMFRQSLIVAAARSLTRITCQPRSFQRFSNARIFLMRISITRTKFATKYCFVRHNVLRKFSVREREVIIFVTVVYILRKTSKICDILREFRSPSSYVRSIYTETRNLSFPATLLEVHEILYIDEERARWSKGLCHI